MDTRYEIRDEIGQGGVGVVYRAWDQQLKRMVAIKRLIPLDSEAAEEKRQANQSAVNDLLREAPILSSMQHPNIVSVFDAGLDGEGAYVVMELIDGEVLRDAVEKGSLVIDDFKQVVDQTLEALISAHHHGLLHRDIKPRNLMLRWLPSEKFQVKLLDFGLAKFSSKPEKQTQAYEDTIMGSSAYMAPEQFEHKELDARTDLYQLGCVYYYALTGLLPFDGDTPADVMDSHLQHRVTPLAELRNDLPPALGDWVMKLIEREPADRPATAKAALRAFQKACNPNIALEDDDTVPIFIGAAAKEGTKPQFMLDESAEGPKPMIWKWIGAVAIAIAVGLGTYLASKRRPSDPALAPTPALDSAQAEGDFAASAVPVPRIFASDIDAIRDHLDQVVTVQGTVTRTGQSAGGTSFLNFDEPHFFIVSFPSDRPAFRLDPFMLYEGKEIAITGTIVAYEDRYQIKLSHPDQVNVIE